MGRPVPSLLLIAILILLAIGFTSCGNSNATRAVNFPAPAKIALAPANIVSIDLGTTQSFSASPQNRNGTAITTPVSFRSSNTAVVTVANNGLACAGTWDSVANPQICTPGPVGMAEITASAQGISSPPTQVFVHQHVDKITISELPGQTAPQAGCFSKTQTFDYQASAFSHGTDVTSTIGTFFWQAENSNVVTVNAASPTNIVSGLRTGQMRATAKTPGTTSIFAGVSNVNSSPLDFVTCAVQSITLSVIGSSDNTVLVSKGTGKTITATVIDTQHKTLSDVPLSWSSSQPAVASVSASGSVSTSEVGAANIIASCTPPSCNIGFQHSLPIYPAKSVSMIVTASSSSSTPSATVFVSSTECANKTGCISTLVPITSPANTLGSAISLPATPNSLIFGPQGNNAYLGTDANPGQVGSKGLMVVSSTSTPAVSQFIKTVPGKALAVSPDGKRVIVSDTIDTPNQVFIVTVGSSSAASVPLKISGATAAAFSPDNLKAFIVAGNTLYVYSAIDALQAIPLSAPATDVAFLGNGMAGYLAGGDPAGASFLPTCDAAGAPPVTSVAAGGVKLIQPLPGGQSMIGIAPPDADFIQTTITGSLGIGDVGCPAPVGALVLSGALDPSRPPVNLGVGSFTARQVIVAPDGAHAYILAENIPDLLVVNVNDLTPSAIAIVGGAVPLQAGITPAGNLLYEGASDGRVHVLDPETRTDIQQISFPGNSDNPQGGLCTGVTFACRPDLVAVKP